MSRIEDMIREYLVESNGTRYTVDFPIHKIDVNEKRNGDYSVSITYQVDYGDQGGIQDEYIYDEVTKTELFVWLWEKSK